MQNRLIDFRVFVVSLSLSLSLSLLYLKLNGPGLARRYPLFPFLGVNSRLRLSLLSYIFLRACGSPCFRPHGWKKIPCV